MRVLWSLGLGLCVGCSGAPTDDAQVPDQDPSVRGEATPSWVDVQVELAERSGGFPKKFGARVHSPDDVERSAPVVLVLLPANTRADEVFDTVTWLASWGFVSVVPTLDAPGNPRSRQGLVDDAVALIDWMAKTELPIDVETTPGNPGLLGFGRGASVAALTSVAEGGERVAAVLAVAPDDFIDDRATPPEDWPAALPSAVASMTDPLGIVSPGKGVGPSACIVPGDGAGAFFDASPNGTARWHVPSAAPPDFIDPCAEGTGGPACTACNPGSDPAASAAFARATAVAFFRRHLADDEAFDAWLDGELSTFPEDVEVSVKGGAAPVADTDADTN